MNLGTAEHSMCESLSGKKSDIPGLECRVDNPLEFLGLYHTMHNACRRHDIPAKIVIFHNYVISLYVSIYFFSIDKR